MCEPKRFFAGTNSGRGFYSFFQNIIGPEAKLVYLLKGGPGTGKSRFMGQLTKSLQEKGHEVKLFFCSSDADSLDAVVFPKLGAVIVDATHPHALEAQWPGCRDEIIWLGNFWNGKELRLKREEIKKAALVKEQHFATAFKFLEAARLLEENIALATESSRLAIRKFLGSFYAHIDRHKGSATVFEGRARRLFASAFTPQGYVSHLVDLIKGYQHLQILSGPPGAGKSATLNRAVSYGLEAGFDMEIFHYPLDPHKVFHVLIPELSMALLTSSFLEPLDNLPGQRIEFASAHGGKWAKGQDLLGELLGKAVESLGKAKASHGVLEKYYQQQMDFESLEAYGLTVLEEILSLEESALIIADPTD